jgi:hypothetical protein
MWSKAVSPQKLSLDEAQRAAQQMNLGGHTDWRVPTIKELYSLIGFRGYTGFSGRRSLEDVPSNAIPCINTDYFDFLYGPTGERYIDAQWLTSTKKEHQGAKVNQSAQQNLYSLRLCELCVKLGIPTGRRTLPRRNLQPLNVLEPPASNPTRPSAVVFP